MNHPPILLHHWACPSSTHRQRAASLAKRLQQEQPRLDCSGSFAHLRAHRLGDAPVLHLDDFSDITVPAAYGPIDFLEDRARLRAADGDLILTRIEPAQGYESYCRDRLGLGSVRWLRAQTPDPRRHLAASSWIDSNVRAELRRADFRYVHPHMGSFAVWALADLLARSSGRDLEVIAPPPNLTKVTNDKLWVADVVSRLLGSHLLPPTRVVSNFSTLAWAVRELAVDAKQLVVKLTDSVGGGGNLVLDASRFRDLPLGRIRLELKSLLAPLEWRSQTNLLVGCWETDVLSAPSTQIWIPPLESGEPCIEGLFEQVIEGRQGLFVGTRPARLPPDLSQEIVDSCWLMALVFQYLGYVGRCSFDLILVGSDLASCAVELVECNARWGGTSLPMTLLTRLLGDWKETPFACLDCALPEPAPLRDEYPAAPTRWRFSRLIEHLGAALYDVRTGQGDLILYNPAAMIKAEVAIAGLGERFLAEPTRLSEHLHDLLATGSAGSMGRDVAGERVTPAFEERYRRFKAPAS